MKLAGGVNAYQYVPNPTGWVDPLGLTKCPGDDPCKPRAGVEEPTGNAKVDRREPITPSATTRPKEFASKQKLDEHFDKHGPELGAKNSHDYLITARHVVKEGIPVHFTYKNTPTTGYVLLLGTNRSGQAKFAFAGTNTNGDITTLHTKSGKDFWRMINGDVTDKTIRPYRK